MKNHQAGSSIYNAYPPHNLVENSDGKYTIELATAGFTKEELEVKTEYSKLTISGRKAEEEDDEKIVHKGIAKRPFSKSFTLASYAHRLRGFTVYPDGCRGGQPLSSVPYSEAVEKLGEEFEEGLETHDICDITGHGGSCGV